AVLHEATPGALVTSAAVDPRGPAGDAGIRPVELVLRRAGHRDRRLVGLRRATRDQRGLDRDARRRNVGGSVRCSPCRGGFPWCWSTMS
ncbi:hypothetical protein HR12_29605, partial [Microbacterium sp. SUBG005]